MYYSIGEKQYWIEEYGQGIPLLLLHGFTGSAGTWDSFVEKWKDDYRVITIDLPGHRKTKGNKIVRMEEFCDDLHKLLSQLEVDKVNLIGYSLGGRSALSFSMMYPEKVANLVLESASPGLRTSHEQLARQTKDDVLATKIEEEGLLSFVNYWEKLPLFRTQHNLDDSIKTQIRQQRLNQTEAELAASLRGMGTGQQPSWWEQLPNLTIRTLLIVGEWDSKFVDIAKRMNDSIKTSELKVVQNAGHAVHLEQARDFDIIVSRFMKDNRMRMEDYYDV